MEIKDLAPVAITFMIIAIILGVGADVIEDVQETTCGSALVNSSGGTSGVLNTCPTGASNITWTTGESGLNAVSKLADWLPTIALVIAAALVIGVVVAYFKFD